MNFKEERTEEFAGSVPSVIEVIQSKGPGQAKMMA